jgi:hypothetical protein
MSQNVIIPILSAIVGTAIAWWLKTKWARWMPVHLGTKDKEHLLKQYGRSIKVAHRLTVLGFCCGAFPYFTGWMNKYDWRGLGLAFGLSCFLPLAYFVATNAKKGDNAIRESLIAYAMWQKTPPRLLFSLMGLACVAGVVSAAFLLL